MKILMLGWEYPPRISGGLGVASQGLARALASLGHDIDFFLPRKLKAHSDTHIRLLDGSNLTIQKSKTGKLSFLEIGTELVPYLEPRFFQTLEESRTVPDESELLEHIEMTGGYGENLTQEIKKYAWLAASYASKVKPEVIHGHDWITFPACMAASAITETPFIAHIHSTEIERNGAFANDEVREIETLGLKAARSIIAVSSQTRSILTRHYGIDEAKIHVVPNGIDMPGKAFRKSKPRKKKRIGFVGRLTHQKGPGQYLSIARELLNRRSDLEFVLAGDGYLAEELADSIKSQNLVQHMELKGFLSHDESLKLINQLDVLVVPSVAEPFGLVVLEAALVHTPVVVSAGAGVSEFVEGTTEVLHWDIHSFANAIEKLIDDPDHTEKIRNLAVNSVKKLTWPNAAKLVRKVYEL